MQAGNGVRLLSARTAVPEASRLCQYLPRRCVAVTTYAIKAKLGQVPVPVEAPATVPAASSGAPDTSSDDSLSTEEILDFNRVTTLAMRVFLHEDRASAATVQDAVIEVAAKYTSRGNRQATTYLLSLYSLLQHQMPKAVADALYIPGPLGVSQEDDVDELERKSQQGGQVLLRGRYLAAFNRVFALVEDSGWRVSVEGVQSQGGSQDEEILRPPELTRPSP